MHIELIGQDGVKITTGDKTIILAPIPEGEPAKPTRGKADVVVLGRPDDKISISPAGEKLFVIGGPGEYESAGVFFYCLANWRGNEVKAMLTSLEAEGVTLAHLNRLDRNLSEAELELFENIDILLVPVGGDEALDAKKASQLVAEIEPRVVIPLGGNVENFLKEMGSKAQPQDKLKITKKDLPQEGMQIFNIQP